MKKVILVIGFLLFGLTSNSQVLISLLLGDKLNSPNLEFGLEGGYNFSNITGMDSDNYRPSFNLGFYFDIRLKDQWWLDTGVLVKSSQGFERLTDNDLFTLGIEKHPEEGSYEQVLKSFIVPIQLKYKFKNYFYAEGGIQLSWVREGYVEFTGRKINELNGVNNEQSIKIREDNTDDISKISLGPIAGFGYKLKKGTGWTVGLKYYYGLVDVYKDIPDTKNSSFFIKLNVPIGVGKKVEKTIEVPEEELIEEENK
jgi:hypothetical protein